MILRKPDEAMVLSALVVATAMVLAFNIFCFVKEKDTARQNATSLFQNVLLYISPRLVKHGSESHRMCYLNIFNVEAPLMLIVVISRQVHV